MTSSSMPFVPKTLGPTNSPTHDDIARHLNGIYCRRFGHEQQRRQFIRGDKDTHNRDPLVVAAAVFSYPRKNRESVVTAANVVPKYDTHNKQTPLLSPGKSVTLPWPRSHYQGPSGGTLFS